ncbi:MAG: D-aminoacyl-tRNA deacylase [Staphylothermus sp.]|nr:D-aminoacyl-tRNA deacylase [Staphylothermus sp.]
MNKYFGLVYSVNDPAGKGIADYIREYYGLEKSSSCLNSEECFEGKDFILAGFKDETIYLEYLDERLPGKVTEYIVLSRHSSARKVKSYTVHHTGNFGDEALYGGKPRSLGIANPVVSHKLLLNLWKLSIECGVDKEYEVSYEATHHGPTENKKPLCFIEIGSSLDEWHIRRNHEIVGLAVIRFLENPVHECRVVAGVGGRHYPWKHTKYAIEENYCYGHIMAKYALAYLSYDTLNLMINKSIPRPEAIVIEKKGTRKEHREIIEEYANQEGIVVEYI